MGWHYQARKKTYNGEVQFELVEAYPDLRTDTLYQGVSALDYFDLYRKMEECVTSIPHTTVPHTNEAVTIRADTKEDLAKWLRQAADDVEKYEVIDGDEGSEDGPSPQNSAKEKPLIDNLLDNFFEGWKV